MKIIVAIFYYNEGEKIRQTVNRHPKQRGYDLLLMNDGSTDQVFKKGELKNIIKLRNQTNLGIGAAMKRVFRYSLQNNYDVLVIQAGNNKDNPKEILRLLKPILKGKADFVQGSRFLRFGGFANIPAYRVFANRFIHPLIFSFFTGKKVTDSTNGFRAFKTSLLRDKRIQWRQKWLNRYELEPYLLYKTIVLGYRHMEIPVTKIYPSKTGYTKMHPIVDWWSILKPVIFLGLGLKK